MQDVLDQVIESIADVEGVEPIHLDISLQTYVAMDAIQELANHESDTWRLQFETPNHLVEVTGHDEIFVDGTHTRSL